MRADDVVLALNAGSSSLKAAVFEGEHRILGCVVEALGAGARVRARGAGGDALPGPSIPPSAGNASDALPALLAWVREQLGARAISAVGHRVVHGGLRHAGPARVTAPLLSELEALVPLAPLHQPHNLAPMRRLAADTPDLPQVACFDTAFHRTMPETEQAFALPRAMFEGGIRRYGFHGLSYEYIASRLRVLSPRLAAGRTVVAHLGAGASACALRAGVSVATTMGFTALDGLPMGTRCGALDPGVVLHLLREEGLSPTEVEDLLYRRSGMLGLSGGISADFRDLLTSTDSRAAFALEVFTGRVAQQVAALAVAMGGLDGLVFTAGIGEHAAPVRARIVETLDWLGLLLDEEANARHSPRVSAARSKVEVLVVPTDEELVVARQVRALRADAPTSIAGP